MKEYSGMDSPSATHFMFPLSPDRFEILMLISSQLAYEAPLCNSAFHLNLLSCKQNDKNKCNYACKCLSPLRLIKLADWLINLKEHIYSQFEMACNSDNLVTDEKRLTCRHYILEVSNSKYMFNKLHLILPEITLTFFKI